eukprot:Skav233452  [mRNA]  locus=scaffold1486:431886:434633:- [translate_table: standard]
MSRPSSPVIKEPKGNEDRNEIRSPPPTAPPPGLEKDETETTETAGPAGSAWGPGGNGGGPRRLLMALHMLQEAEMLTPAMFASLAVQWLPLLTQRVARKVDKINHMARQGLDQSNKAEQAAKTQGLKHHATGLADALSGSGGGSHARLGEAVVELLKALRGLSFEVAASLMPYLEGITSEWIGDDFSACEPCQHPGSNCSGCGAAPITGPRFKCTGCPDYSLCGNCYPQKIQLHGHCPHASKDFQCIMFPAPKGGKGREKGDNLNKSGDKNNEKTLPDVGVPFPFDWSSWAGKGAGACAAVGSALAQHFATQAMLHQFPPAFGYPMAPYPGMEQTMFEEGQDIPDWPSYNETYCPWSKGKGKGKKGRHKKSWQPSNWEEADAEFERKVTHLLEFQLANEEVIRELLATHHGDVSQVVRVLTS